MVGSWNSWNSFLTNLMVTHVLPTEVSPKSTSLWWQVWCAISLSKLYRVYMCLTKNPRICFFSWLTSLVSNSAWKVDIYNMLSAVCLFSLLTLSLTNNTHTHTHVSIIRERERERKYGLSDFLASLSTLTHARKKNRVAHFTIYI